jgi:dTDP-4-dehydrorhamnose 3,5-epimerase
MRPPAHPDIDYDTLPCGVRVRALPAHGDARGDVVEIFDASASPGARPRQWNLVRSEPGVLRGMHIHPDRADVIAVLAGRMRVGLMDARARSPSFGRRAFVELDATQPRTVEIPVGVLHGFHFPDGGMHAYGLTEYWHPHRDIGCRWDDPDLALPWNLAAPIVVERDLALGSLADLLRRETQFATMPVAA